MGPLLVNKNQFLKFILAILALMNSKDVPEYKCKDHFKSPCGLAGIPGIIGHTLALKSSRKSSKSLETEIDLKPLIEVKPSTNEKLHLGGNLLLYCRVINFDQYSVKWERFDGTIISKSIENILTNEYQYTLLKIENATKDDFGEYLCFVNAHQVLYKIHVNVTDGNFIRLV